jgi:hypothetical protein
MRVNISIVTILDQTYLKAVVAIVSASFFTAIVAVVSLWAAGRFPGPLSISVALVTFVAVVFAVVVVASATRIVLAVSEEFEFSDKTLIKFVNEMTTFVTVSHIHESYKHLTAT